MHVLIVRIELHLPQSRSLKEKRAAIRPVVEGVRNRFSLSVAEVDYQDKWQRAAIGGAVVSASQAHAREVVEAVERYVWSKPEIEVAGFESRWYSWEDGDGGA
ncbi:MAG: DUF503 domain-containing protein [Actinomycetota bacterium]|nr:DUF503 domain-containing protein [Actinomycetota bacterium]